MIFLLLIILFGILTSALYYGVLSFCYIEPETFLAAGRRANNFYILDTFFKNEAPSEIL